MIKRNLGASGLEIGPLALGGNVFGWTADEPTSFRVLDAFVAAGFNFIDTADAYSLWVPGHKGGESETVIGNWLRRAAMRDRVIIATKVGVEMAPGESGLSKAVHPARRGALAAAAQHRVHRSVSVASRRPGYAHRRDARGVSRS